MNPQWHDIIFLFLPGLIAVINRPDWSGTAKYLVALGVCVAGAFLEVYLSGTCNWADMPGTFAKVFILVMGSYAGLWKRFDMVDKVEGGVNAGK